MSVDTAIDYIHQISSYRNGYIKLLSITGGEPFYHLDTLKEITSFAEQCGMMVSVVTNAYWANSKKQAVSILKMLKSIRMLSISTDVYHQQNIPLERVENAVYAVKTLNIPYSIAVCTEKEHDTEFIKMMVNLKRIADPEKIRTTITLPFGRALKNPNFSSYPVSEEPPISACIFGNAPVIFPNGRIVACIGPVIKIQSNHPMEFGNLQSNSLCEIFDKAELNSILHAVRIWGPRKLISILQKTSASQYLPKTYLKNSICDACYNMISNTDIVKYLDSLRNDQEFNEKVAYARIYYLGETEMARQLGLGG